MKSQRLEDPSGWLYLTRHEGVQLMIDALLDAGERREFNKQELSDFAGVSRPTVQTHIDRLVDLRVVAPVENTRPQRYRFDPESRVSRSIIEVEAAVNDARADDR